MLEKCAKASGSNGDRSRIYWVGVVMIFFVFPLVGVKVCVVVLDQGRNTIINIASVIYFAMLMEMGMLDADRVGDQKPGRGSHQDQPHPKGWHGKHPEDQEGKDYPQKWSNGIVGTGFCGAKLILGFNVEIDA